MHRRIDANILFWGAIAFVCGLMASVFLVSTVVAVLLTPQTSVAQSSGHVSQVVGQLSPVSIAENVSSIMAEEEGRELATHLRQTLENRNYQKLVRNYEIARPAERKLLGAHLGAITTPERLADALRSNAWSYPDAPSGRLIARAPTKGRSVPYMAMVPPGYTPEKAWPMHISLHGGGGNPTRNCELNWQGEPSQEGVILVCPQVERGYWWMPQGEKAILAVLRDVQRRYHIDTNRISLGGASSGGFGTWYNAAKYPWLFRAAVPRCAATPRDEKTLANLVKLPVFMLHGVRDGRIQVENSRRSHELLTGLGYQVRYEEEPKVGHVFMRNRNFDVLSWIEDQTRPVWGSFRYRTLMRGQAPTRVHWLRVDWGESYEAGHELSGWIESRKVQGAWQNEVHITSTAQLRSFTILMPPGLWQPDAPVEIFYNKNSIAKTRIQSSVDAVLQSWEDHQDPFLISTHAHTIELLPSEEEGDLVGLRRP